MFDAAISFVCHERLIMNWFESGRHSLAADRRGHAKLDLEERGRMRFKRQGFQTSDAVCVIW